MHIFDQLKGFVYEGRNTIFTNSFHGVCFAALFRKEFYAFSRKSSGKVIDMCRTMGLEDRYFAGDEFAELGPGDWDKVYEKPLRKMIEQSRKYVSDSLGL